MLAERCTESAPCDLVREDFPPDGLQLSIVALRLIVQMSRTLDRSRLSTKVRFHPSAVALFIAAAIGLWGCGGGSTYSFPPTSTPPPGPLVAVTVAPNAVTLVAGATQSFTA